MMSRYGIWMLTAALLTLAPPVMAQAVLPADPLAFAPEKILLRTPNIDGKFDPAEWTPAYSLEAPQGALSAAAGWDSQRIYFALDGPAFSKAVLYVDANGDGWLNGPDNYEFTLEPASDGSVAVTSRLYNSLVSDPSQALRPALIDVRARYGSAGDRHTLEMSVERSDSSGLELKANKRLAFAFGVGAVESPDVLFPADPRAALRTVTLAQDKLVGPEGIVMDVGVKDREVVPGQTLSIELFINNTTDEPVIYSNYEIGGEAGIADLVDYSRVHGATLEAGKRLKRGFSTDLPADMPLGAFLLRSALNLADGTQAVLLTGFEVQEPIVCWFDTGSGPLAPGQERRIAVMLKNNRPSATSGTAVLEVPAELADAFDRTQGKYLLRTENSTGKVEFRLRPGESTPPGQYEIRATVTTAGFEQTLSGLVLIQR